MDPIDDDLAIIIPEGLVEVYSDNLAISFKLLEQLSDRYKFIAIDTEFPGRLDETYIRRGDSPAAYDILRDNINGTECMQLGIALATPEGEIAPHRFSFNFHFDLNTYAYSPDSIGFLTRNQFDFDACLERGIDRVDFSRLCDMSGLFRRGRAFAWVFFEGSYDVCHYMKVITNQPMPQTHTEFQLSCLRVLGHDMYDVKVLKFSSIPSIQTDGLEMLCTALEVLRVGRAHEAASDALATLEIFFRILNRQIQRGVVRDDWLSLHVSQIQHLFYKLYS